MFLCILNMSESTQCISTPPTSKTLQELKRQIAELDKTEQLEILKIIQRNEDKLTENKNGIFINLRQISPSTVEEINKFVRYSIENHNRLNNLERLSEALMKESMLTKQYDRYEQTTYLEESVDTLPVKKMAPPAPPAPLNEEIPLDEEDEEKNLKCLTPEKDDEETDTYEATYETTDESLGVDTPPIPTLLQKRNKFTGRNARIMKKCKEITRTYQSDVTCYTTSTPLDEEDDGDFDDDDDRDDIAKELTEETPP